MTKLHKSRPFHLNFSDANELFEWGIALGIPKGSFCILAKDELYNWPISKYKSRPLPDYIIVNLGTVESGGTHWVAYSPSARIWFDSYGGYPLQKIENSFKNGVLRYSKEQYQLLKDQSCGLWAVTALAAIHKGVVNGDVDGYFRRYKAKFKQGRSNNATLLDLAENWDKAL